MSEEFSLVELEDKSIVERENFAISRPGLYPSEASVEYVVDNNRIVLGNCLRASWYRSMKIRPTDPAGPGLSMKGYLGKWNEIGTVEKWKELGIWLANNVKFFNPRYFLSGELDAIIKDPKTDKKIGIEMKTFYGYNANKELCGAKKDQIPGVPKDSHFMQASLYAWEYKDILDDYRLYYLERGDGHRVEFRVGFDETPDGRHVCWHEQIPGKYWGCYKPGKVFQPYTIEDIYSRYDVLLNYIKNKTMPAKDFSSTWSKEKIEWMRENGMLGKTKYEAWKKNPVKNKVGDWNCSYCKYKTQCDQDEITAVTDDL